MGKRLGLLAIIIINVISLFAQIKVEISTEKVIIDGQKFYLHNVQDGQTLYSICRTYKISEDEIYLHNPEIKDKMLKTGQNLKIPVVEEISSDGRYIVYVVKSGDTLYSLCRKYGISEEEFYVLNDDLNKRKSLKIGQEIKFPIKVIEDKITETEKDTINFYYHLVEKGETVYSLVRQYNVTKEELIENNPEFDGFKLIIGEVLKIPKSSEKLMDDTNRHLLDSLGNLNFPEEDTILNLEDICDEKNWYKYGKSFDIILLLPFEIGSNIRTLYNQATGNREQRLYMVTEQMIAFYSGCLMALDKYKNMDIKINFSVYDTGNENVIISSLLEKGIFDSVDLIIGPAYKSQIEFLNSGLDNDNTAILLPFVNDSEILQKYSGNIMLKPANDAIVEAITDYASMNKNNNYLIIQGNKEDQIQMAGQYKKALLETLGDESSVKIINFKGGNLESLKTLINKEKENVFILPFYSETICTNILLDLFPLKDYNITLISDERVLDYQTIDPSYFAKVKFTYYSEMNVNFNDELTNSFISEYRDVFLCEPDDNSFLAYDAVNYFVRHLLKYGNNFLNCIAIDNTIRGLSGFHEYIFKESYAESSFTNTSVYIYTMQEDFTFQQVYPVPEIKTEE